LATTLYRGLKEELILFWVGGGSNGKTFLLRMVSAVLGDYATKLNINLLTSKRENPDKPNSAIMSIKGKGFGYFEESSERERLQESQLKNIVSGKISSRDLNSKQETFDVNATLISASNYDFLINSTDHGTWRRIKYYRSKITFCKNPRDKLERKEDPRFVQEFIRNDKYKEAFFSILSYFWCIFVSKYGKQMKNVASPTIEAETHTYRVSQDKLHKFICENVVCSTGSKIKLDDFYEEYTKWYEKNVDKRHFTLSTLRESLENSCLSKYVRTNDNKQLYIKDCRLLMGGDLTGDEYFPYTEKKSAFIPPSKYDAMWWKC
jgi:phage/plasmid-associated DNA primase